jgi:hypothetical protein
VTSAMTSSLLSRKLYCKQGNTLFPNIWLYWLYLTVSSFHVRLGMYTCKLTFKHTTKNRVRNTHITHYPRFVAYDVFSTFSNDTPLLCSCNRTCSSAYTVSEAGRNETADTCFLMRISGCTITDHVYAIRKHAMHQAGRRPM